MNRLPTSSLSDSDRENIINLRVTRQKNLTEVSDDDLNGLTNVVYVKIARNYISRIGDNAFVDQQALIKLDLHGNRLTSVPRAIRHLPNLRQLNLGANLIRSINPEDFSRNTNLEFLILRNNYIQEFPTHLPQNLVKLSLVHNQISSVGDATRLSNLILLRLDDNQLTDIPNAHNNISSTVQELTLCTNKLTSASVNRPSALGGLTNLRRLRLSGNPEIRHISSDFLSSEGGRTLRELDLNFCGIEDIVSDAFACAHDLQHVGLAGNRLQMYDIGWLVHNRRLRGVELSGNPWRCTCEFVAQLKSLKKAVEGRIARVVERTDESDMDKISTTFNNDFYNISCSTVDPDLKVDVETEEYSNFTSYQNAPCVNNVAEWKFQKRRQTCNSINVVTPEVVEPPMRTVRPTTRRVVEATTRRTTTTTRPPTTRSSTTTTTTTTEKPTTPTTTEEPASKARFCTTAGNECVWPATDKDGVEHDGSDGCMPESSSWTWTTYQTCFYDDDGTPTKDYYCEPCEGK